MTIGKKIKDTRLKQNLTQEQLAKVLNVSRSTVSSWEVDRNYPDLNTLITISDLFEVSLDTFLRGDAGLAKDVSKKTKWYKIYRGIVWVMVILVIGYLSYNQKRALDVKGYQGNLIEGGWYDGSTSKDNAVYILHEEARLNKIINYLVTIDTVSPLEWPFKGSRLSVLASFHQHDFSVEVLGQNDIILTLPIPQGAGLAYSVKIDQKLQLKAANEQRNKNYNRQYTERYLKMNRDNIQTLITNSLEKRAIITDSKI